MKAMLPFGVRYIEMEKLAIVNFEKNPDMIYKGLELQYLNGKSIGEGYRVLAYRNDGYVDMYDDNNLIFNPNEKCDVSEKGLNKHVQIDIINTVFEKKDGCVHISFEFEDLEKRAIHVNIVEKNKKKSTSMNLLAPIGYGSQNPSCLPIFFLYDFDFIRRKNTIVDVIIDGKALNLDPFPFPIPINGQRRYYTRYTMESQIIEFLPTDMQVKEVELDEHLCYYTNGIKYQLTKTLYGLGLSLIEIMLDKKIVINFIPAFVIDNQTGEFSICPSKEMGSINGTYEVKRNGDIVDVTLIPDKGWMSVPNSFISKLILSPKSIFCNWCKEYRYSASIDLKNMSLIAKWVNGNKN